MSEGTTPVSMELLTSSDEELLAVLLLTLSNLAFLPTIGLALYRRFFTLAVIFFFNCFFSAFYHACDTNHDVYQLCIMNYSTLAFCDFFGSVLSFFAVLVTMARIPETLRTFLLVTGALVIATCQDENRHSELSHVLPLVVAGLVLIISWIRQMYLRRQLFPSKRRYLFFLLPGVVLAASGIGINYGLSWHQSLYKYTHSYWHVALMTSPCLLMPPRPRARTAEESEERQPLLQSSAKESYDATEVVSAEGGHTVQSTAHRDRPQHDDDK